MNDTDLKLRFNSRMNSRGQRTSSMDRYEVRPFTAEADAAARETKEREAEELQKLKAGIFQSGWSSEEEQWHTIREEVFRTAIPLTRETEAVRWDRTTEFFWMSICLSMAFTVAAAYLYAGKKKKEREKRLADIDNHYKE